MRGYSFLKPIYLMSCYGLNTLTNQGIGIKEQGFFGTLKRPVPNK